MLAALNVGLGVSVVSVLSRRLHREGQKVQRSVVEAPERDFVNLLKFSLDILQQRHPTVDSLVAFSLDPSFLLQQSWMKKMKLEPHKFRPCYFKGSSKTFIPLKRSK